jgi:hypothetical protein
MLLVMLAVFPLSGSRAQGGITVENAAVTVDFGKSITFSAKITTSAPIQQASLLFRGVNETVTRVETVQVGEDGLTSFTYDVSQNVFPPFGSIVFWFQATLSDGQTHTSAPITFPYNDNRFPWREMERNKVTVHWYAGDDAFGAAALDAAAAGMLAMNEFLHVPLEEPVNIYIYSSIADLQNTLLLGGQEWVGGHASPEIGVALVAITPGSSQVMDLQTKIPHELTHVMLYRALGSKYNSQPAWLLEGIASMMEQYPNPDYARALQIASENDSLLAFDGLCQNFPADAGNAYLAYAQSQSFVTYIRETYGTSGLGRMLNAYGDGFSCELGATSALGTPLTQLEERWREDVLGQNKMGVAARNLLPFILLLLLVSVVPIWGGIDMLLQRRKHADQSK